MNVENLYSIWFLSHNPGGELIVINNKLMSKIPHSSSYQDITHDRMYNRIRSCIEQRAKSTSHLFTCSCGVCQSYLITDLYHNFLKKQDERIMDEALREVSIDANERRPLLPIPSPPQPTHVGATTSGHPLDNMIMAFGKHKDKSYKDIFKTDREYCLWCIETVAIERSKGSRINDSMISFAGYVRQCLSKV